MRGLHWKIQFHARSVRRLALAFGLIAFAGCGPRDREINAFIHESEASVAAADYVVQPPDAIEISSSVAPEIDGEKQVIRQDGKITLRLLGEIQVAGMTPAEIGRKLESLLLQYYVQPKVNVRVSSMQSKRYYVFGDGTLGRYGAFPFTGRDTVLTALAGAQPNTLAWKSHIKLIRPSKDKKERHVLKVDADRIVEKGKLEQNVMLEEGDILWVPPTPLGWLGLRLSAVAYPVQSGTSVVPYGGQAFLNNGQNNRN